MNFSALPRTTENPHTSFWDTLPRMEFNPSPRSVWASTIIGCLLFWGWTISRIVKAVTQ